MASENSQEHMGCVKNAHGLENGIYFDRVNLLPAENSSQRWMVPTKILLKILIIFEISPEGSMLVAEACSGFTYPAPTISRRFPRLTLTNYYFFSLNVFRLAIETPICTQFPHFRPE